MKIRRVLMPTDFSECANAALGHALFLADRFGAELDILHVVVLHHDDPYHPTAHFPDADDIYRKLSELAASGLDELLGEGDRERLNIREVQKRALAAAPEVVRYAEKQEVDLIVMGSHGRRGWRRFLLGSVAEEVVRTAPCAVLTLRESQAEVHPPSRILAPFDFSEASRQALVAAKDLAVRFGASLEVLHVIEPPLDPDLYVGLHDRYESFDVEHLAGRTRKALEQEVAKSDGPDPDGMSLRVEGGRAGTEILRRAEESEADLLVISDKGRSGFERFMLGSVAEKVIRSARCPVLTLEAPTN
ncbi:MAG: universal stress protein [Acidobacteriota bacterium]